MLAALFLSNCVTALFGFMMAVGKPTRHTFILVSFVVIAAQSIIIGVRDPSMMTDTREYVALFQGGSGFEDRVEPFFMAIIYGFRIITDSSQIFLILMSSLINSVYFLFLYSLSKKYSLLVFGTFSSTFSYWLIHVQIIRSGLACIFLLLALSFFISKKNRRGLGLFFLAIGTHFSLVMVSAGAFFGYAISGINFKRVVLVLALISGTFTIYEYVLPNLLFFAPWQNKIDAYKYYNEHDFIQSGFDYRYVLSFSLMLSFPLFWRRHNEIDKIMFWIYISVSALSFAFWSNILFRDRIFILAQLIEPFLIARMIITACGYNIGPLLVFAFSIFLSLVVVFYWGPRTVLIF